MTRQERREEKQTGRSLGEEAGMEVREREFHCCGQKIQYFLGLEHGIHLSVPRSTKSWRRSMSSAPDGGRTEKEGRYRKPLHPER